MKFQSAAKRHRRVATLRPVVLALMSAGVMMSAFAQNLPQGMTLKAGDASIATVGNTMTTTQRSSRAVWESTNFSIAAGNVFASNGPAGSLTLVRVVGNANGGFGQSSQLNGSLLAQNTFMLVNPFGIYVGGTAVLQAANLMLSTKDLRPDLVGNGDYTGFMNSNHLVFDTNAGNGYGDSTIDIKPGARLTATADGGSIYLVADNVRNQGAILAANASKVGLLAVPSAEFDVSASANVGDSGFITLTKYANYDYTLTGEGQDLTSRVAVNTGSIDAPNGSVTLVGVGAQGPGNHFDDIDDHFTPLYASGIDANYGSGAFNSGTINADKGQVSLVAQGPGSISAVTGTVTANAIRMSGEIVRVGLYNGANGQLIADGADGGGTIDLGDTARAKDDATNTKWIYVSGASGNGESSTLSASATDNGNGGTITLQAMYADQGSYQGTPRARYEYGQVEAYGDFIAQGGPRVNADGLASGGKVTIAGQAVNVSYQGMQARFLVGTRVPGQLNGSVSLMAPYVNIAYDNGAYGGYGGYGGHYEPTNGESLINPDVISQALQDGANVSVTASSDGHNMLFGNPYLYMDGGTQIDGSGSGQRTLVLQSDDSLTIDGNTTITAGEGGPLDVQLTAKGNGLYLYGYGGDGENDPPLPVAITTNGGNLTINGTTANYQEGPSAGVYITQGKLDTHGTAGNGLLTINGTGAGQTGVLIEGNTSLVGNHVLITGVSQTGTGVSLSDTTVAGATGVEVYGLSRQVAVQQPIERAAVAAVSPVSTGPTGVNIGSGVVLDGGQGNITVLGRSASGDGVRIQDLTLISALAAVRQRFTIAGESGSGGLGVNVLADSPGIQMHDQNGPASTADVVIGGTSSGDQGQLDIELGQPKWNTTGNVNIRPLTVKDNGTSLEMGESLAKAIHVGNEDTAQTGDFVVRPEWFNSTANGAFGTEVPLVIGSSNHTGKITVADNALDGAGNVTLQNQGAGSGGIQLGSQGIIAETLNLVTAGNITQTGPIMVRNLRIITAAGSTVALNLPQNLINTVSANNQPAGVAPQGVAAQASLANAGSDGIVSYDQGAGTFRVLSITANGNYPEVPSEPLPTLPDVSIPRPFEGPDALSDLRTDVYVHGQLGRPQICTAANTSGGAAGPDGGAEPLALEWVKVKRSAQLSNCSGVRTDSSCSAF